MNSSNHQQSSRQPHQQQQAQNNSHTNNNNNHANNNNQNHQQQHQTPRNTNGVGALTVNHNRVSPSAPRNGNSRRLTDAGIINNDTVNHFAHRQPRMAVGRDRSSDVSAGNHQRRPAHIQGKKEEAPAPTENAQHPQSPSVTAGRKMNGNSSDMMENSVFNQTQRGQQAANANASANQQRHDHNFRNNHEEIDNDDFRNNDSDTANHNTNGKNNNERIPDNNSDDVGGPQKPENSANPSAARDQPSE